VDKEEGERLKERIAKKQSKAGLRDINLEQYRYTHRSIRIALTSLSLSLLRCCRSDLINPGMFG